MKHLLSFLFFSVILTGAKAADRHGNYRPVHYLTHEWLMYDQEEEVYVPFRLNPEKEFQAFTLPLDLSRFPHAFLLLKTPPKAANIFMNNALDRVSKKPEWVVYDLDSLRKVYRTDSLRLTLFTASSPASVTAYIGFPSGSSAGVSVEEKTSVREVVRFTPRSVSHFNSGVAVAFVLSLIVMSFVSNNYFRVYGKYYSLRGVFSTRAKDDLFVIGKPLDRPSVFFVILLSVVVGFFILMLQFGGISIMEEGYIFQSGNSVSVHVINFLKLCPLVLIVFLLRFFFLSIIGKLFNLGKVTDLHYFKVIQCSLFFYSLLLLTVLFMYNAFIPFPENVENYLFVIFCTFYSGRGILIYFTINRESNVKFLYLFSYLCIAEALPIILGMRFLFL